MLIPCTIFKCTFTLSEFLGFEGSIGTRLTLVSGKMELVIFPAIGSPFIGPEDFLLTGVGLFVRMHSIVVLLFFALHIDSLDVMGCKTIVRVQT